MAELMNYGHLEMEMDQTWVSSELKISPTKVPENYSRIRDVKIRFGSKWHLAFLDRNGRESVALGDTVAARNGERFLDRRIFAGVVFPWRK